MDTSNKIVAWKTGMFSRANPQKVADEIESIGSSPTPIEIVEKAKDNTTELYKCFEWDDSEAAQKWRLHQARQICCQLIYVEPKSSTESAPIRIFYKVDNDLNTGYTPTKTLVRNVDEYAKLYEKAMMELRAFKMRYSCIKELQEIFDLID